MARGSSQADMRLDKWLGGHKLWPHIAAEYDAPHREKRTENVPRNITTKLFLSRRPTISGVASSQVALAPVSSLSLEGCAPDDLPSRLRT